VIGSVAVPTAVNKLGRQQTRPSTNSAVRISKVPQRDGQSGPAAGTPALDRPDWYAERLASIGDREALYVDQHDAERWSIGS